jgi:hypothetical protein
MAWGSAQGEALAMRQGTILVVAAMDERAVVLRSRAGRYRLGA